jgi:hypothetical protein
MNHLCGVERVKRITHGRFSDDPEVVGLIVDREEVRTEPCGTPLFTDAETNRGICRSCFSGWEVEGNRPTDRGYAMIEDAVEDADAPRKPAIWDGKSAGGGTFERGE